MSVLDSYGPVDKAIARRLSHAPTAKGTVRRNTLSAPEYKPFSRDDYSLGRYQRASSARLVRSIKKGALLALGIVAAALFGAALAAFSSGPLW